MRGDIRRRLEAVERQAAPLPDWRDDFRAYLAYLREDMPNQSEKSPARADWKIGTRSARGRIESMGLWWIVRETTSNECGWWMMMLSDDDMNL
jgi:hypothetical protein